MAISRLDEIIRVLETLPKGNITVKTIRNRPRMYLQWTEYGKQRSKYIKKSEESLVQEQLALRRQLEEEYRRLTAFPSAGIDARSLGVNQQVWPYNMLREESGLYDSRLSRSEMDAVSTFKTNVTSGPELASLCGQVALFKPRNCMKLLKRFLSSQVVGKVCLVFGLRRTGKTTLIFQAISTLPFDKTAYIKIMSRDSMSDLNHDLRLLAKSGIRYLFIDEVTLLADFIDGASLFSDIYSMYGMKVVLSGTDSLGFAIAEQEELYDRTVTIHTTFIPFREYSSLLGIHDVDTYIQYGGTFRIGETDFDDVELLDDSISFRDDESTRRYIDTAIARNIQHSLACYQSGGHFRHLRDLYEKDELTNAINRIIEDMNHHFLISVLTKDFKSHDLGSAMQLVRKQALLEGKESILDTIDKETVTKELMRILQIRNLPDQSVEITEDHILEIKEYLKRLELIMDIPAEGIRCKTDVEHIVFTQPGMRYCQAQALVHSTSKDDALKKYHVVYRKQALDHILEEVRGRMLEEIVLLETVKVLPRHKKAFKLMFDIGEIDMVIADTKNLNCELYEIKHTNQVFPAQYRHLIDEEKCADIAFEYGEIQSKTVLYRGQDCLVDDIQYRNVEQYLEGLGDRS